MKRSIRSSSVVLEIDSQLNRFPISKDTETSLLVAIDTSYDDIGDVIPDKCLKATGVTSVFSEERDCYITVVLCSLSVSLSISLPLAKELLESFNDSPVYALVGQDYYPITATHGEEVFAEHSYSNTPTKEFIFLHTISPKENKPIKLDATFKRYLVKDSKRFDWYPESIDYYSCESFDAANALLRHRVDYYKERYERFNSDDRWETPTNDTNRWGVYQDKLSIGIYIIDLETIDLALPPENLV